MLSLHQIVGKSMEPALKEGKVVLLERSSFLFEYPRIGELVVAKHPTKGILLIKLISGIKKEERELWYWLEGANKEFSQDSRQFGWVSEGLILGRAHILP